MIGEVRGVVRDRRAPVVTVEIAAGFGVEVWVPLSAWEELPLIGGEVRLFTHLVVREEEVQLYGFLRAEERETFRVLVRVPGVGPRTALALLSHMTVTELEEAVRQRDAARLRRVPGIGPKTAERLVLELKGRLTALPRRREQVSPEEESREGRRGLATEVLAALVALGYREGEVEGALRDLPGDLPLAEGVRWALQRLARG
ncbi:MAG: Holliday junction branch migration protein RuvA [Hydrogenophilus sp.]|nr:Holliday junction branch migration protein RuvA [Hydrogenophilus sp.]